MSAVLPSMVRVDFTKDELLVCLRALTSIHEFDPKRDHARNAFTKMIRAGQQSKDAATPDIMNEREE